VNIRRRFLGRRAVFHLIDPRDPGLQTSAFQMVRRDSKLAPDLHGQRLQPHSPQHPAQADSLDPSAAAPGSCSRSGLPGSRSAAPGRRLPRTPCWAKGASRRPARRICSAVGRGGEKVQALVFRRKCAGGADRQARQAVDAALRIQRRTGLPLSAAAGHASKQAWQRIRLWLAWTHRPASSWMIECSRLSSLPAAEIRFTLQPRASCSKYKTVSSSAPRTISAARGKNPSWRVRSCPCTIVAPI